MKIINFPTDGGKPDKCRSTKEFLLCELKENKILDLQTYRLSFLWQGTAPKAGQFFMIKPERTVVFLARPFSVAAWHPTEEIVHFLIALRGKGTNDLANMYPGEYAELLGPLGNTWMNYLSPFLFPEQNPSCIYQKKPIALIGGGICVAPLQALAGELQKNNFDFYAGFKTGFIDDEMRFEMLGSAIPEKTNYMEPGGNLILATEDGSEGCKGRIPDFLDAKKYAAVCACGPAPMLAAVSGICREANVPCFISMERNMACGIGACMGCAVKTIHGNRRCCADGPIFPSEDLCLDE